MENASKALIIAGAILISIVIITLGVMIVNNVTGLISGASDMSEQEVATFNSKFLSYEGSRVSGSNARALFSLLKSHNNQHRDDPSMQISLNLTTTVGDYVESPSTDVMLAAPYTGSANQIAAGKTYTVKFGRNSGNDRITACSIIANSTSGSGSGSGS